MFRVVNQIKSLLANHSSLIEFKNDVSSKYNMIIAVNYRDAGHLIIDQSNFITLSDNSTHRIITYNSVWDTLENYEQFKQEIRDSASPLISSLFTRTETITEI